MRRKQTMSGHKRENGIVILLVAVVLLFVVGAMAALAIDTVTFYTARSEAQLAADGAALAGARVLANSGLTSTAAGPAAAEDLARAIATQVAASNKVGGRNLIAGAGGPCAGGGEISVCFNDSATTFATNPQVTVKVQRTDLPTFFARIWGNTQVTVQASATAEAYNPSGVNALDLEGEGESAVIPVAPTCVKPWLLPNIDPTQLPGSTAQIFNPATGAIIATGLVNEGWPSTGPNPNGLYARSVALAPAPGRYYPGAIDAADFPVPTQALPACSAGFTPYQLAIAGCVLRPIRCGSTATSAIAIDTVAYVANTTDRDTDTAEAVSCLIHYNGAATDPDSIDTAASPSPPPFQFKAGNRNPVANAVGKDVLVSDSLVTIPVFDTPSFTGPPPTGPVTVIGFLQVLLGPPVTTSTPSYIPATIINMVGCGTGAGGQPILGNGASPVPVRLVSPQPVAEQK